MTQAGLAGSGFFVIARAGRRTGRAAGARGAGRARQPGAGAPAGAAQPAGDRGDAGRRAGGRPRAAACAPPTRRRARLLAASGMGRPAPFQLRGVRGLGGAGGSRSSGRSSRPSWPEAGRDVALEFEPRLERARCGCACASRAPPRAAQTRSRGVLRAVPRGPAQRAGAQPAGEAGGDGPRVGRHRARDPQPAGGHRAGQRAAGEDALPTPSSSS